MRYHKEIKVGIFCLVGLLVAYFGSKYILGQEVFSSNKLYHVRLLNVAGLSTEDPVTIDGYKVGSVKEIKLLPNKGIKVSLSVQRQILLREGTVATLVSTDFLGSKEIVLSPTQAGEIISSGDSLEAGVYEDVISLVTQQFLPLGDSLRVTAHLLNESLRGIHLLEGSILPIISKLDSLMIEVDGLVKENRRSLSSGMKNVEEITAHLSHTTHHLDTLLTSPELGTQITSTLSSLEKVSQSMSSIVEDVQEGKGSLGKLVGDEALFEEIKKTVSQLNLFLEHLDESPRDFLYPLGRKRKTIRKNREKAREKK
ncbi:MAG: MlaD family protein [Cytophagales bacterium]|nr:MlaD family protein [Cytophagales bacterium]